MHDGRNHTILGGHGYADVGVFIVADVLFLKRRVYLRMLNQSSGGYFNDDIVDADLCVGIEFVDCPAQIGGPLHIDFCGEKEMGYGTERSDQALRDGGVTGLGASSFGAGFATAAAFFGSCSLSSVSSASGFAVGASSLADFFAPIRFEMSSPSAPTIAIGSPSGALSPSLTKILSRTPFASDCISIVALSVSISASGSPIETLSPSFFNQRESCPSSIVGDSFGITTWVAISGFLWTSRDN